MGTSFPDAGQCDTWNAGQGALLPSYEWAQHLTSASRAVWPCYYASKRGVQAVLLMPISSDRRASWQRPYMRNATTSQPPPPLGDVCWCGQGIRLPGGPRADHVVYARADAERSSC